MKSEIRGIFSLFTLLPYKVFSLLLWYYLRSAKSGFYWTQTHRKLYPLSSNYFQFEGKIQQISETSFQIVRKPVTRGSNMHIRGPSFSSSFFQPQAAFCFLSKAGQTCFWKSRSTQLGCLGCIGRQMSEREVNICDF